MCTRTARASGRRTRYKMGCRKASLTCDSDGRRAVCWRWSASRAQLKRVQQVPPSARRPPRLRKTSSSKRATAGGRSLRPTWCGDASAAVARHCARGSPRQLPAPSADDAPPAGALVPASMKASADEAHGGRGFRLLPPAQICCSTWLRSRCLRSTSQLMEWTLLPRSSLQWERKIAKYLSSRTF